MAAAPGGGVGGLDLDAFRDEWRADIRQQRHAYQLHDTPWTSGSGAAPAPDSSDDEPEDDWAWTFGSGESAHIESEGEVAALFGPQSALSTYADAVLAERNGDLDAALRLYRSAFRADESVDRTFRRAVVVASDPIAMFPLRPPHRGMPDPHRSMRRLICRVRQAGLPSALARPQGVIKAAAPVLPHDDADTDLADAAAGICLVNGQTAVPGENSQDSRVSDLPRAVPSDDPLPQDVPPGALTPKQRQDSVTGVLGGVIASARALRADLALEAQREAERGETRQAVEPAHVGAPADPVTAFEKLERLGHMTSILPADKDAPCPLASLPEEVLLGILMRVLSLSQAAGMKRTPFQDPAETDAGHEPDHHEPDHAPSGSGRRKRSDSKSDKHPHPHPHPHLHLHSHSHPHAHPQALPMPHAARAPEAEPQGFDAASLETFARTCWKVRLLSLEPFLWRQAVRHVYVGPQVRQMNIPAPDPGFLLPLPLEKDSVAHLPPKEAREAERERGKAIERAREWGGLRTLIRTVYGHSPRDAYILQPRVRTGGVYIASCQYLRDGQDESSAWIRVLQRIEYFRYLRFYPSGRALSLQTTDTPQDTVRRLHHPWIMRQRGSAAGKWALYPSLQAYDQMRGAGDGAEVDAPAAAAREAERATEYAQHSGPVVAVTDLLDPTMPHMRFFLVLTLRQANARTRGTWNRLDVVRSQSLNLRYGTVDDIPARHRTAFLYSPVRSFTT